MGITSKISNIQSTYFYDIVYDNFIQLTNGFLGNLLYPGFNIKYFNLQPNKIDFKILPKKIKKNCYIKTSINTTSSSDIIGIEYFNENLKFWINKDYIDNPYPKNIRIRIDKIEFILSNLQKSKESDNKIYYNSIINKIYFADLGKSFRIVNVEISKNQIVPWFIYFDEINKNSTEAIHNGYGYTLPSSKITNDLKYSIQGKKKTYSYLIYNDNIINNNIITTFSYNEKLNNTGVFLEPVPFENKLNNPNSKIGKFYNLLQGISNYDIEIKRRPKFNTILNDYEFDIYSGNLTLSHRTENSEIYWDNSDERKSDDNSNWILQPVHNSILNFPNTVEINPINGLSTLSFEATRIIF